MYPSLPENPHDLDQEHHAADVSTEDQAQRYDNSVDEPIIATLTPPKIDSHLTRFFIRHWRHKRWILPLALLVSMVGLLAIPVSRYTLLAYAGVRRQFTITVMDSKTGTSVSGAQVMLDGASKTTSSIGRTILDAKVGLRVVHIRMKYYKDVNRQIFVGIARTHNSSAIKLEATGRQVPIMVVNQITGKAIAGVNVRVLDTEATTDEKGMATIVLPTSSATQPAIITATGYNQGTFDVHITAEVIPANTLSLTPAGRVYFLSNRTGTVDVVSTNVNGTNRQTVLAGTGSEDTNGTALLATHDWKYLTLISKRDGGQHAKLFVINTATNQVTPMDSDKADFTPIGWSGHYFIYEATLESGNAWQPGKTVLRSYNADTGKMLPIDQTTAQGTDTAYIYDYFGFADIVNDHIVYGFGWNDFNSNYVPNNVGGQKIMLMSANASGNNKQDLRDISISNGVTYAYATALQYTPQLLYIQTAVGSQSSVYYAYQYQNNSVTQSSTITSASFNQAQQNHIPYLVSPSGNATFWSEQRDGKNTLLIGDTSDDTNTQIAVQSDYIPYAWFTDAYVLVQKNSNELYIMSVAGGTTLKVSDYYHPNNVSFGNGSIGSYGDL